MLSLALGMLMDPSKRSYVNNKLDEDRRKKEKYAVMEKKKRGLVDVSGSLPTPRIMLI